MKNLKKFFSERFSDIVIFDEPMKNHTTFKIGGNADYFFSPRNVEEIIAVISSCKEEGVPYFIVGNGSNLLVSDKGIRGAIISISKRFKNIHLFENKIFAQSGALLSATALAAAKKSLTGMEFASGIPGTLGGAVAMNAGAYGGEMKDIVENVIVINNDVVETIDCKNLEFEYRNSRILKENLVVLGVQVKLENGNEQEIREKMQKLAKQRNEKQPVEFPSAGSTFKRPEGHFAGKLIMDCGLRGACVGGAAVSEKHCGFIVNKGGATASDVICLIEQIKDSVYKKFGVMLEPEVKVIGEF